MGAISGGMAAYISCPAEVSLVRMSNDNSLPLAERRNYKGTVTDTFVCKNGGNFDDLIEIIIFFDSFSNVL